MQCDDGLNTTERCIHEHRNQHAALCVKDYAISLAVIICSVSSNACKVLPTPLLLDSDLVFFFWGGGLIFMLFKLKE